MFLIMASLSTIHLLLFDMCLPNICNCSSTLGRLHQKFRPSCFGFAHKLFLIEISREGRLDVSSPYPTSQRMCDLDTP